MERMVPPCPLPHDAGLDSGTATADQGRLWRMTSRTPILCSIRIILLLK